MNDTTTVREVTAATMAARVFAREYVDLYSVRMTPATLEDCKRMVRSVYGADDAGRIQTGGFTLEQFRRWVRAAIRTQA